MAGGRENIMAPCLFTDPSLFPFTSRLSVPTFSFLFPPPHLLRSCLLSSTSLFSLHLCLFLTHSLVFRPFLIIRFLLSLSLSTVSSIPLSAFVTSSFIPSSLFHFFFSPNSNPLYYLPSSPPFVFSPRYLPFYPTIPLFIPSYSPKYSLCDCFDSIHSPRYSPGHATHFFYDSSLPGRRESLFERVLSVCVEKEYLLYKSLFFIYSITSFVDFCIITVVTTILNRWYF